MTTNRKGALAAPPKQKNKADPKNYNPALYLPQTFADHGIDVPHNAHGNIRIVCPQCSPTRKKANDKCLSVNVTEGVWHCHHCHWKGSLKQRKTYTAPTVAGVTQAQINHALIVRELTKADRACGVTHSGSDLKAIAAAAQALMIIPDAQRKLSDPTQGEKVATDDESLRRTVDALRSYSPSWATCAACSEQFDTKTAMPSSRVCLVCEGRDHG